MAIAEWFFITIGVTTFVAVLVIIYDWQRMKRIE